MHEHYDSFVDEDPEVQERLAIFRHTIKKISQTLLVEKEQSTVNQAELAQNCCPWQQLSASSANKEQLRLRPGRG